MKKYKNFASFEIFESFAKNGGDVELLSKLAIVQKFKMKLPELISKIRTDCVKNIKQADSFTQFIKQ